MKIKITVEQPKPHTGERLVVTANLPWKEEKESLEEFEKRVAARVKRMIRNAHLNTKRPDDEPRDPALN